LAPLVPRGFDLWADEGAVVIQSAETGHVGGTEVAALIDDDKTLERAAQVVERTLSTVQDFIAETTTDPWPRVAGANNDMAVPHAEVSDQVIRGLQRRGRNADLGLGANPVRLSAPSVR
jgi:sulfur carrier protein ThiS